MKKSTRKRHQKQQIFYKTEKTRLAYKILQRQIIKKKNTNKISLLNNKFHLSNSVSPIQIYNTCFITGRTKGLLTKFNLSRIIFREHALKGLLPGIKKATW